MPAPEAVRAAPEAVPTVLPVAVVIPCRNGRWLMRTHAAITSARAVPAELVIVDDGSDVPLPDRLAGARTIRTPGIGRGRARNLGAAHTSVPYLWFVDADVTVGPDTLARLWTIVAGGRADAAMGVYAEQADLRGYEGFRHAHHRFQVLRDPEPRHLSSACLLIRRACLDELGGFPDLPALEDVAFGMHGWRRGYRWRSEATAAVYHQPRDSAARVLRRDYRERGVAAGLVARRHGLVLDHAGSPRELTAFAAALGCLAGLAGAALDGRWLVAAAAALAVSAWADAPWLRYAGRARGTRFAAASLVWLLIFRLTVTAGVVRGYLGVKDDRSCRPGALGRTAPRDDMPVARSH